MTAASDDRPLKSHASMTVRKSWEHMGLSVALCVAILAWYAIRGAPVAAFVGVTGIGVFLVAYNIVRITRARDALREPARLAAFAKGQRRSHKIRGRVYLVGAPIVVGVTWIGMLSLPHAPADAWAVLLGLTLFLSVGWVQWLRVLRRMA